MDSLRQQAKRSFYGDCSDEDEDWLQELKRQRQQEQSQKFARIKRSQWLSEYYNFKQMQKQRREFIKANQNTNIEPDLYNKKLECYQSQYEKVLIKKKDNWTSLFIDQKLKQAHKTQQYLGIQVTFPKEPYDQQKSYIKKVIQCLQSRSNGFIESPTGTGKTLCMLTSTLAWVYHQKKNHNKHYKIIYLSRTHSQLEQVQKQLQQTCYRPTMAIMGSREHFCIHTEINKDFKGHELIQKCSQSRKAYFKLKKVNDKMLDSQQSIELQKMKCPHYRERYQTVKIGQNYHNKIWRIDEIKQKGQNHFCPYYYPIYMEEHCDLFLMPYNYLLDINIFQKYVTLINDSIIIFDQAHNVADSSCDGRSFQCRLSSLDGFISQLQDLIMKPAKFKDDRAQLEKIRSPEMILALKESSQLISDLKECILSYLSQINFQTAQDNNNIPQKSKLFYLPQEKKFKWTYVISSEKVERTLVQLIINMSPHDKDMYFQSNIVRKIFIQKAISKLKYIIDTKQKINEEFKEIKGFSFFNMDHSSNFLKRIINLLSLHNNKLDLYRDQLKHYCLALNVELGSQVYESNGFRQIKNFQICLTCLVPWFTFEEIRKYRPYSILFTSGTMKPIDEWKHELNVSGKEFVNDHVIQNHQVRLNIVSHNTNNEKFDFSSTSMKPEQNNKIKKYQSMLNMIVSIIRYVPGGIIVIFPNYRYVQQIKQYFKNVFYKINQQIQQKINKKQFFEEKNNLQQIKAYKQHIQRKNGGVLYGVCRGKASQGVDFPDDECRAVIFIGIPFSNDHTPLMMQKKLHYKKLEGSQEIPELKDISWSNYYFNSMIRAINQGLGRVIRHKYDYGQLFLIDSRYLHPYYGYVRKIGKQRKRYRQYLPSWAAKQYLEWGHNSQEIMKRLNEIKSFYEYNKKYTIRPS